MALKQQIMGAWSSAFGNATTYVNPLTGGSQGEVLGTQANYTALVPVAGTIRNLRITAKNDLAGSDDVAVFTIMKNGSDTTLVVTINDSTQSADSTNSVSFAASDTITLKRVTTGSPSGNVYFYSIEWQPTTADVAIYGWGNDIGNLTANEYDGIFSGGGGFDASSETQIDVVGVAGTLTTLAANLSAAPGGVTSRTFTVWKNGVIQDGTAGSVDTRLTITGAATSGTVTFSLSLAAGDRTSVRHTVSGSPAAARCSGSAAFTSGTVDAWNWCGALSSSDAGAGTYLYPANDHAASVPTTTESDWQYRAPITPFTITGFRAAFDQAPGAGTSRTLTFRKDSASTAQALTIADTNLTGTSAGAAVSIASGNLLSLLFSESGAVANMNGVRWSFQAATSVEPIVGSFVAGVTTTVTATRAAAFGLDNATNVHDEIGKLKVFGDFEVTGISTFGGAIVRYAEVAISSAEILALRATPKTLVAAPGAGLLLEFAGAVLLLDATATAYVESSANLSVKYTDGSGAKVSDDIEATGFIDQTADTMTSARPKADAIVAKTGCENKALVLHNLGAGEYTTGTGVMRVKVAYRTWATGW